MQASAGTPEMPQTSTVFVLSLFEVGLFELDLFRRTPSWMEINPWCPCLPSAWSHQSTEPTRAFPTETKSQLINLKSGFAQRTKGEGGGGDESFYVTAPKMLFRPTDLLRGVFVRGIIDHTLVS